MSPNDQGFFATQLILILHSSFASLASALCLASSCRKPKSVPNKNINAMRRPKNVAQRCVLRCLASCDWIDVALQPNLMRWWSGKDGMNQQKIRAEISGDASCYYDCLLFRALFHKRVMWPNDQGFFATRTNDLRQPETRSDKRKA